MNQRRHDLDAIRGMAMLLGIFLHAALSLIGIPWIVQDPTSSEALGGLVSFVHGFRMPLFFLLSGFFTAMLWQRRGLAGLLSHRAKRILLPLVIGCLTVVPAMWGIIIVANATNATYGIQADESEDDPGKVDIWRAAATGNLPALNRFVEEGAALDPMDPFFRQTPLAWAVITDQLAAIDLLLASGAGVEARSGDGNTALHSAAFLGRAQAGRRLLAAGGGINTRNDKGETPIDSMGHGKATVQFIAGLLKIKVDYDQVLAGRAELKVVFAKEAALSGSAKEGAPAGGLEPREGGAALGAMLTDLMHFPFFHHLWFLWFLCWLVLGFALVVLLHGLLPWKIRLPGYLVSSPLALLWLVPLTMLTQTQMHMGGAIPGFGPDTSAGLLPFPHVLVHYVVFFGFGALAYLVPGAQNRLGRGWWLQLPLALIIWPGAFALSMHLPWGKELAPAESTRHLLANLGQSLFVWLMIFGSIGLCQRLLSRERPWVRFLSDSAYWLYLVHLPLVIAGQALLRPLDLPVMVKFTLLLTVVTVLLLLSYRWLVRYTFIGRLLNGPRSRQTVNENSNRSGEL